MFQRSVFHCPRSLMLDRLLGRLKRHTALVMPLDVGKPSRRAEIPRNTGRFAEPTLRNHAPGAAFLHVASISGCIYRIVAQLGLSRKLPDPSNKLVIVSWVDPAWGLEQIIARLAGFRPDEVDLV